MISHVEFVQHLSEKKIIDSQDLDIIPFVDGDYFRHSTQGNFQVTVSTQNEDELVYLAYSSQEKEINYNAKISFYSLKSLKQTKEYKNGVENKQNEVLINTWKTRKYQSVLMKYSDDCKNAFMFNASSIEKCFQIFSEIDIADDGYLFERRFCRLLAKYTKLQPAQVQKNLSDKRFQQVMKDPVTFVKLIGINITLEHLALIPGDLFYLIFNQPEFFESVYSGEISILQMEQIDTKRLARCRNASAAELNQALICLSVPQLLGLSHQPKPVEMCNTSKVAALNKSKRVSFHSDHGLFDNYPVKVVGKHFSYSAKGCKIKIIHHQTDSVFRVEYKIVKNGLLGGNEYSDKITNGCEYIPIIALMRDWYCVIDEKDIDSKDISRKAFYCPDLQYFCEERLHKDFPVEEFYKSPECSVLLKVVFYQEAELVSFLYKHNCDINQIKVDYGIEKLKIFCHKLNELKFFVNEYFVKDDMTVSDLFKKVYFDRVDFIFKNIEAAKVALKFVGAQELFGISNATNKQNSPRTLMTILGRK